MLVTVVAGLVAAQAVPRLARPLLPEAIGLARSSQREYRNGSERIVVFLEAGRVFGVAGGTIGALVGLFLVFPLASILGLFGSRT
jgi:hypothetical protein